MNLVIDIGNTHAKIAVFDNRTLVIKKACSSIELVPILNDLFLKYDLNRTILSTVAAFNLDVQQLLESKSGVLLFDENTPIPLNNLYKTPETLGKDRIANAVGAFHLFKNENVLCIDLGTCIKFDVVTKHGQYVGGSISPGLSMRFQALNEFTANLPLIELNSKPSLIGTDTTSSIQNGIQLGIQHEISGLIKDYREQYSQLKVVLTGGDHIHFAKALKNSIFARPNLTLQGLNEVLIFNE